MPHLGTWTEEGPQRRKAARRKREAGGRQNSAEGRLVTSKTGQIVTGNIDSPAADRPDANARSQIHECGPGQAIVRAIVAGCLGQRTTARRRRVETRTHVGLIASQLSAVGKRDRDCIGGRPIQVTRATDEQRGNCFFFRDGVGLVVAHRPPPVSDEAPSRQFCGGEFLADHGLDGDTARSP